MEKKKLLCDYNIYHKRYYHEHSEWYKTHRQKPEEKERHRKNVADLRRKKWLASRHIIIRRKKTYIRNILQEYPFLHEGFTLRKGIPKKYEYAEYIPTDPLLEKLMIDVRCDAEKAVRLIKRREKGRITEAELRTKMLKEIDADLRKEKELCKKYSDDASLKNLTPEERRIYRGLMQDNYNKLMIERMKWLSAPIALPS